MGFLYETFSGRGWLLKGAHSQGLLYETFWCHISTLEGGGVQKVSVATTCMPEKRGDFGVGLKALWIGPLDCRVEVRFRLEGLGFWICIYIYTHIF